MSTPSPSRRRTLLARALGARRGRYALQHEAAALRTEGDGEAAAVCDRLAASAGDMEKALTAQAGEEPKRWRDEPTEAQRRKVLDCTVLARIADHPGMRRRWLVTAVRARPAQISASLARLKAKGRVRCEGQRWFAVVASGGDS